MHTFNTKIDISHFASQQNGLQKTPWTGNPTQMPREYITFVDIVGVTQAANNSVQLNLGLGVSGELITKNAMLFNAPGILSLPLSTGNISSTNSFSAANTSTVSCQGLAYLRNDQWIVFATRDTRSQAIPGTINAGETAIYCQGSNAISYYRVDGSITHQTSDGGSNSSSIKVVPTAITETAATISATNGGTLDYVSLDSKTRGLIDAIVAAVNTASAGVTGYVPINQVAITTAEGAPAGLIYSSTASSVLKADK